MGLLDELTEREREWVLADEARWQEARRIADRNPTLDVSGIYHVLKNLEKSPSQRLRAALDHGRLFRTQSR